MTTFYSVIGSNYGDEGKGVATHTLASSLSNNIVVKTNGGCQAGHTVTTLDGTRHVFRQMGAGTFAGSPTFWSQHFLVNPIEFFAELDLLNPLLKPSMLPLKVFCDPRAQIATPFDALINQIAETYRGNDRHGSCGYGINETVVRGLQFDSITMEDLLNESRNDMRVRLCRIRDIHMVDRIREVTSNDYDWMDKVDPQLLVDDFVEQVLNAYELFTTMIKVVPVETLLQYSNVIFEHSQGLMLDQNNDENFPHVTRSNTGLKNAADICHELGAKQITAYYVTRSYLTRHGAGPLSNEVDHLYNSIQDPTNIHNKFQGQLRYAPLDLAKLRRNIMDDVASVKIFVTCSLIVTCWDQLPIDRCVWIATDGAHLCGPPHWLYRDMVDSLEIPITRIMDPTGTIYDEDRRNDAYPH